MPRFSDFLVNELIPEVAKQYNLSKNPDDRALSGVSTGAVGAFMAAWNRPDQFHRVLSLIGTYVAMKGADALPALVRRTEPKPIRIFMQDGSADHITAAEPYGTHFSGSWPINNQVMYEALEFAGYDAKLVMGTDGHSTKQGGAILPDALRWLWRDYPAPIVVHEPAAAQQPGYDSTDRVFSTVYLDKPWQRVGGDDSFDRDVGQIWSLTSDANGDVYICGGNTVERVDADGNVTQFLQLKGGVGRLRFGPDGRWYASLGTDEIVSFHKTTGPPNDLKVLARDLGIYDFVVAQNGTIYFSGTGRTRSGRIDASGKVETQEMGRAIVAPMGLAFSPDQSMLVVTDAFGRYSWSFQIAADSSLINGEPFYRLEIPETTESSLPGDRIWSVAEDTNGNVYFATPLGIQVAMQNGRISQILNPPDPSTPGAPIAALTFATTGDTNWLYIVENGKLYRRPVKVTGANAWTVAKPPKPTL
jgi:sugar lactone lactonase YvrE